MAAVLVDILRVGVGAGEDILNRVLIKIDTCEKEMAFRAGADVSVGAGSNCHGAWHDSSISRAWRAPRAWHKVRTASAKARTGMVHDVRARHVAQDRIIRCLCAGHKGETCDLGDHHVPMMGLAATIVLGCPGGSFSVSPRTCIEKRGTLCRDPIVAQAVRYEEHTPYHVVTGSISSL